MFGILNTSDVASLMVPMQSDGMLEKFDQPRGHGKFIKVDSTNKWLINDSHDGYHNIERWESQ